MKSQLETVLQQQLRQLMKGKNIKHAILAVESMDGSFKWLGADGIARPDKAPMTPETPFCIASVTKLYIAVTILKLQEQGRISIDKSVAEYLPDSLIKGMHQSAGVDNTKKSL